MTVDMECVQDLGLDVVTHVKTWVYQKRTLDQSLVVLKLIEVLKASLGLLGVWL